MVRADLQFKPPRPTARQWFKALLAGLIDANAASNTGVPPDSTYDPMSDCKARAVLLDADDVVWSTGWTYDTARAQRARDRLADLLADVGDDEVRQRVKSRTLLPEFFSRD